MAATTAVRAGDVIAFRLRAHHLAARQPAGRLLNVAGACAVPNSPPGSALLALHARVDGVTRDRFDDLVARDRSLLQTWCMRGAPHVFPTAAADVFTAGALPATESARRHLVAGVEPALQRLGLGLDEAVDLAAQHVGEVLSGRRLAIGELGRRLADRVAGELTAAQLAIWREPGQYAANQPLGEAVLHFCLRILTLRGMLCMAPRSGRSAPFVMLSEWLGCALPLRDRRTCRADLLRRYLHCYGPSARQEFAAWLGVRSGDVEPWWAPVADELANVDVDGRRGWMLGDDLAALASPPSPPFGVRLLPRGDPYTQARDRSLIVAAAHHCDIWKAAGSPGTVLADGRVAGVWRHRRDGRTLSLTMRTFRPLNARLREQVLAEADGVARLVGASAVAVEISSG